MSTTFESTEVSNILVRPVQEPDLVEVRRIFRVAFGTFIGVPDPESFWPDREYIFTRWRTEPEGGLVAELNGKLAGSNFATNWGSFGFFGPLTVRPDLWDQRVAQRLLAPTMDLFAKWGVRESGLFTFPQSAKHVGLYQKFGFWPRFLTAVMAKSVNVRKSSPVKYSMLRPAEQEDVLSACRKLTDLIYEGLDVSSEIRGINDQRLGDTVLLWGGESLDGFAVCHCGEGTEAGRDTCFIKFAGVRPGPVAATTFDRLLEACEALAAERCLSRMEAGVNIGRSQAYRQMLQHGFRTHIQGVAMHRPDLPGYNRPDVFVVDDWR